MTHDTILIEISGGVVTRIISNNQHSRVIVIDHDNIDAGDPIDARPRELDNVDSELWKTYNDSTSSRDMEIREELKRNHI